ncbi:MAG: hypothetical protein AAGE18_00495 [Pseudomonadota bacterium]
MRRALIPLAMIAALASPNAPEAAERPKPRPANIAELVAAAATVRTVLAVHPTGPVVRLVSRDGSVPGPVLRAAGLGLGAVLPPGALAETPRYTLDGVLATGDPPLRWQVFDRDRPIGEIAVPAPVPGSDIADALGRETAARFLTLTNLAPPVPGEVVAPSRASGLEPVALQFSRRHGLLVDSSDRTVPQALLQATAGALGYVGRPQDLLMAEAFFVLDGRLDLVLNDGEPRLHLRWTVTEDTGAALGTVELRRPADELSPGALPSELILSLGRESAALFRALPAVARAASHGPRQAHRPRPRTGDDAAPANRSGRSLRP